MWFSHLILLNKFVGVSNFKFGAFVNFAFEYKQPHLQALAYSNTQININRPLVNAVCKVFSILSILYKAVFDQNFG